MLLGPKNCFQATVNAPEKQVNRRDFLRISAAAAGSALMAGVLSIPAAFSAPSSDRPNIVLIMCDDMGYSDLGCYGGEIKTPVLDGLAANGLRFTQFYNAARCVPTRASLMTGLYPHQAGLGHMVSDRGHEGYRGRLNDRCVTIAEVLKQADYQTFMSGKWHVTPYNYANPEPTLDRNTWPLQRGFDKFFGTIAGAGSFYTPVSLMRDNQFIEPGEDFYYTDAINDHAADYIHRADKNRPLFLYVAHTAPHWPLHAPEEDIARYAETYTVGWDAIRQARYERMVEMGIIHSDWPLTERDRRVPPWDQAEHKDWQARRMAVHAAMVDVMDRGIGRIVEALKETGRFDNTLILFLSDNGASNEVIRGRNTRHGHFARGGTRPAVMPGPPDTYAAFGVPWANASNTPFRLYKKWIHEGGIATPLIVHWPAGITAQNELSHEVGHVVDIMATCVEVSGATYPSERNDVAVPPSEGVSLVPAFDGKTLERRAIFFEHQGNRAVRFGRWKLVGEHRRPWELYDMQADRTEMSNVIDQHPDMAAAMEAMYDQWAKRTNVLPWPVRG